MFIQGQSREVEISFLGDSITQRLEWQEFFTDRTVANRGIGSDTTLGAYSRLDSVIANKPKTVSILLGINDLAKGRSPDEIVETYRKIVASLKEALPRAEVIVSSILPVKERDDISPEAILATNEKLKQMCTEFDIPYVDAYSSLADDRGFLRDEYALDTVHLTMDGYLAYLNCLDAALYG